jgi:hypothetical protein
MIQTAKLTEVEPSAYWRDVFKRIVSGRTNASELRSILQHAPPHLKAILRKRQKVVNIC